MFGFVKKLALKSIIKDITKKLPLFEAHKDMALLYVDQKIDEVLEKISNAIADIIKNELAKVLNK